MQTITKMLWKKPEKTELFCVTFDSNDHYIVLVFFFFIFESIVFIQNYVLVYYSIRLLLQRKTISTTYR